MAESRELFDCSICLQLLEDPVTTTCGHSYCMKCVNAFWDSNNDRGRRFSCPQCGQTFFPKPVLKRNTLLAALIEEHKGENRQNAAAGDTYAEPGDVQCDVCTGRKGKASMFCLVCLASYCETHLKPHYEVAPLKKHKLMEASAQIRDSICGRHDKLLEIYCRTDQQFICLLCLMGEHKGHDTVAVAEEKCHMQVIQLNHCFVLLMSVKFRKKKNSWICVSTETTGADQRGDHRQSGEVREDDGEAEEGCRRYQSECHSHSFILNVDTR